MYVCGMTVYDHCHIGHARVMVFFDLVKRWFEAKGFRVLMLEILLILTIKL